MNRRQFLQTAALAASGLSLPAVAAQPAARGQGKIKVGCLSWCFHPLSAGADPEPALDFLGEAGFDGVELIASARRDLKDFWTDAKIERVNQKLQKNKLQVSQFVLFQPVVEDLSSTDQAAREQALSYFEAGCTIGKKLGAPMINIVAPWARELKGPTEYLPRYYEIAKPKPGEKYHIDIAEGFRLGPRVERLRGDDQSLPGEGQGPRPEVLHRAAHALPGARMRRRSCGCGTRFATTIWATIWTPAGRCSSGNTRRSRSTKSAGT